MFEVEDRDGELVIDVSDGRPTAMRCMTFIQALLKIIDVSYLSRERVQSTFLEDFRSLIHEKAPEQRTTFDWFNPRHDPEGHLQSRLSNQRYADNHFLYTLFLMIIKLAMRRSHCMNSSGGEYPFRSLGIFKDPDATSRKVFARFRAVCKDYFIGIPENHERIGEFLDENISG